MLELIKNIEYPTSPAGGDYILLKKGEVSIACSYNVDPQARTIHIQPKFYRADGSWISMVSLPQVSIFEDSISVNNTSFLQKGAFDAYQVYPELSPATWELVLRSEVNGIPLSEYTKK